MKEIPVEEAVGHVLPHDITEIIKGGHKGPKFLKGHIIQEEDVEVLKRLGKRHIYVLELDQGSIHEDQAAEYLRDICISENMEASKAKEGKISIKAAIDGLLKVDIARLFQVNMDDEMMIATRHNNMPVKKGANLAGTRIIPLVIEEEKMKAMKEKLGPEPILRLLPYKAQKIGLITTGSEVSDGLIKDTFSPVVEEKLRAYNISIASHSYPGDDPVLLEKSIKEMLDEGLDMVILTGGMSVDPDDRTPGAIKKCADKLVTYGSPVLPGAMFCLGYMDDGRPIVGLPGCVMHAPATIFDLVLPRLAAKDPISKEDIAALGHGGLCLHCETCTYPECSFGKGA